MLNDNYLVKKSTPLVYAEWTTLGVNELKIVEVYLSRIDIKRGITCVRFTKKEFADLMGYADARNLKTKVFDERLSKFLSQQIKIDLDDGTGYHRYNLFSDAKCYYDPDTNMAMVDIDCNPKLAPVFLELADGQNNGYKYISYRVEKIKKMESAYSIRLYSLLLDHAWGKYQWIVDLEQLRTLLGATDASYESFKYFNARLLKKVQKEINELTDISFDYEKIVKGRKTTGIKFKIRKKRENNKEEIFEGEARYLSEPELSEQTTIFDMPEMSESELQDKNMISDFREMLNIVNKEWEISDSQILELSNKISNHLPLVTEDFFKLPYYRKSLIWMNFLEDMLRKAYAEGAMNLYRYLISQWDRYVCEICVRE